jgi:hypothetical protein
MEFTNRVQDAHEASMAVNDKLRSIASKCYQVKHLQSFASDARDDLLVAHDPFSIAIIVAVLVASDGATTTTTTTAFFCCYV